MVQLSILSFLLLGPCSWALDCSQVFLPLEASSSYLGSSVASIRYWQRILIISMGNLIWHEYSRYLSLTASIYAVWAGFFGLFYRKFFWDFVGATLRDPGGLQPSPNAAIFITVIVKSPIVQCWAISFGLFIIALDFPLPQLKGLVIYRSIVLRVVMLLLQAFVTALFYQGTNAAIWSLISAMCYTRALMVGEKMGGKEKRGEDRLSTSAA